MPPFDYERQFEGEYELQNVCHGQETINML